MKKKELKELIVCLIKVCLIPLTLKARVAMDSMVLSLQMTITILSLDSILLMMEAHLNLTLIKLLSQISLIANLDSLLSLMKMIENQLVLICQTHRWEEWVGLRMMDWDLIAQHEIRPQLLFLKLSKHHIMMQSFPWAIALLHLNLIFLKSKLETKGHSLRNH